MGSTAQLFTRFVAPLRLIAMGVYHSRQPRVIALLQNLQLAKKMRTGLGYPSAINVSLWRTVVACRFAGRNDKKMVFCGLSDCWVTFHPVRGLVPGK
jgi:hypothetical protein